MIKGLEVLSEFLRDAPTGPGVYRMINSNQEILYIGKAKNLKKRISNYAHIQKLPLRLQRMVSAIDKIEITTTASEAAALLLESNLIKLHQPKYNIELKDNKSFPYVAIDLRHDYPRIFKHRGERKNGVAYFGPFASASDVASSISSLQKSFLIRPCSDSVFSNRTRPCLEYQIKRCSAPCVEKISKANYAELVNQAQRFLKGQNRSIQKEIESQMFKASSEMDYERAATLRDRIKALTQIQAKQHINLGSDADLDVICIVTSSGVSCIQVFFYRAGQSMGNKAYFPANTEGFSDPEILEAFIGRFYQTNPCPEMLVVNKKLDSKIAIEEALSQLNNSKVRIILPKKGEKTSLLKIAENNAKESIERKVKEDFSVNAALQNLAEIFSLDEVPKRIEVFDNSHISGQHQIGAMIVAGTEGFLKNSYRKFNINSASLADDYAMMREVLTRRYSKLKKLNEDEDNNNIWPDLVLIDGGPGHYSIAKEVFEDLGISNLKFICVAKGPDRNAGREKFYFSDCEPPIQLPKNDPTLYYLQRLRDEAHRFAILSHRNKRAKEFTKSALDSLSGIGAKRKKMLILHFGSAAAVQRASVEELAKVSGISKKLAQEIFDQFN